MILTLLQLARVLEALFNSNGDVKSFNMSHFVDIVLYIGIVLSINVGRGWRSLFQIGRKFVWSLEKNLCRVKKIFDFAHGCSQT